MRTIAAFLILCSASFAQPDPVLQGPTTAHPGDIVLIDASETGADHYAWSVDLSEVQIPEEGGPDLSDIAEALRKQGFDVVEPETDDGKPAWLVLGEYGDRLQLSSYPGVYRVTMGCSDETGVALATHTVVVKGGKPPKPDPDDEDDDDTPDPPDPLTALGRLVRDEVREAGGDPDEWEQLAGVYEALAMGFEIAPSQEPEVAIKTTREVTRALLSKNLEEWTSIVQGPLGTYLNDRVDQFKELKDFAGPWREIAAGIKAGSQ